MAAEHRYLVLDGMRGVAAAAILIYHYDVEFGATQWLPSAYLAVDLFFLLSGFVLAHAYEGRFAAGMPVRQFMAARIIRLYPLYILGTGLPVLGLVIAGLVKFEIDPALHHTLPEFAWNIFFLPNPATRRGGLFTLDGPAWSLMFELIVNFLFVLAWRRLTNRVLVAVVGAAACALIFMSLHYGNLSLGWSWETLAGGFARVFFSFPLGVLLYRLSHSWRWRLPLPSLLLIVLALMLWAPVPREALREFYDLFAVIVVCPALVMMGASARAATLAKPVYAFLGAVSYAVYVLHEPLLAVADSVARRLTGHEIVLAGAAACIAAAIALTGIAWIADRIYDAPARAWLQRKLFSKTGRIAA